MCIRDRVWRELPKDEAQEEEDFLLSEFSNEIDQWVIDRLEAIGCDTAAAFVTYTEVFDFPCLVTTVFSAQIRHWGVTVRGHVFHPFGKFLNGSGFPKEVEEAIANPHTFFPLFPDVKGLIR